MDKHTIGLGKDKKVKNNNFSYLKPWYESICDLNLTGFVFHDNLSIDFINTYRNKNITFIKSVNSTRFSNNDYRFFVYNDFLSVYDYLDPRLSIVHMTDCCDVTINKNPESFITGNKIYLCRDNMKFGSYTFNGLGVDKLLEINTSQYFDYQLLNMGVISGKINVIKYFLELFCNARSNILSNNNINMPLGNYIIRKYTNNVFTGLPYCSPFKQDNQSKDYYFKHK